MTRCQLLGLRMEQLETRVLVLERPSITRDSTSTEIVSLFVFPLLFSPRNYAPLHCAEKMFAQKMSLKRPFVIWLESHQRTSPCFQATWSENILNGRILLLTMGIRTLERKIILASVSLKWKGAYPSIARNLILYFYIYLYGTSRSGHLNVD